MRNRSGLDIKNPYLFVSKPDCTILMQSALKGEVSILIGEKKKIGLNIRINLQSVGLILVQITRNQRKKESDALKWVLNGLLVAHKLKEKPHLLGQDSRSFYGNKDVEITCSKNVHADSGKNRKLHASEA